MREMWQGYLLAALRGMGAGGRVILRRNIKCFGAGESQLESLMPDLIRRGRIPRVGINASRATIILRIVAEGDSEADCRAQIEPTVAEIHKHLGTLVYGEGDEELQDVVLRLLGQRGQTLASAEIATAGLVAQWLAKAGGGRRPLIAAGWSRRTRPRWHAFAPGPGRVSQGGESFARAMAIACREQFQTDFGLAVGPLPSRATRVKPGRSISPWPRRRRADLSRFVRHSSRHRRRLLRQARDQPGAISITRQAVDKKLRHTRYRAIYKCNSAETGRVTRTPPSTRVF